MSGDGRVNIEDVDDVADGLKAGDRGHVEAFSSWIYPYVKSVLRRKLKYVNDTDLDDLASLIVESIWLGLNNWDRDKGSFLAWINGVIHHKAVDYVRKKEVEKKNQNIVDGPRQVSIETESVGKSLEMKEMEEYILRRLVTEIDPVNRIIYLLKIVYDLTFSELAEIMQSAGYSITEKAVSQRFYRVKSQLKRTLDIYE